MTVSNFVGSIMRDVRNTGSYCGVTRNSAGHDACVVVWGSDIAGFRASVTVFTPDGITSGHSVAFDTMAGVCAWVVSTVGM